MTMRKLGAILIAAMVLTWVTLAAIPARAETLVDVQSFVNSSGNTVTVTDTYEINGTDVVLISRTVTEVQPDGFVKLEKSWTFYPDGAVKTSDEFRNSTIAPTRIHREYSETGVLLFQRGEMYLNGELALVSLITYNADGYLVSQEDRQLITLADGTQVWEVTVTGYALDGTVSSETVTQYPSTYDFDAPPSADQPPAEEPPAGTVPVIDEPPADEPPADQPPAEEPPADEPPVVQPPADEPPADDVERQRPGWGRGDKNHDHNGPPGKENVGGSSSDDDDSKHKDKSKDKDDKGKSKDKDKD